MAQMAAPNCREKEGFHGGRDDSCAGLRKGEPGVTEISPIRTDAPALMRPQLIAEAMVDGLPPALMRFYNCNRLDTNPPGVCHRAIGIEIKRNPYRVRRALVEIRGLHVLHLRGYHRTKRINSSVRPITCSETLCHLPCVI